MTEFVDSTRSAGVADVQPDDALERKREAFEREAIPQLDFLYRFAVRLTNDTHRASVDHPQQFTPNSTRAIDAGTVRALLHSRMMTSQGVTK